MPLSSAEIEWRDNTPYSLQYDDIYFSAEQGLAETDTVFIERNRLRERWRDIEQFCIIETGFGSGLNFFCTANAFLQTAPATAQLDFISVEKHPFKRDDLLQIGRIWPQLADVVEELAAVYPLAVSGFHQRELCGGRIRLLLLYGDVTEQLSQLEAKADAWYLDGFAPSKNQTMWQRELFQQITRLTKVGGTFSTFTAAGDVRRGLQHAGFAVRKIPGFAGKRHMLVGELETKNNIESSIDPWFQWPEFQLSGVEPSARRVVVIGAGIAGLSTANALARYGWQVTVLEQASDLAHGASGNPAGVVMPRLDKVLTDDAIFYWQAFLYTVYRLKRLQQQAAIGWRPCGVLQLLSSDETEMNKSMAGDSLLLQFVDRITASELCGMSVTSGGVFIPDAGYINPTALCRALTNEYPQQINIRCDTQVKSLHQHKTGWQLQTSTGEIESDVVIIANASHAREFSQSAQLPLESVRGQVSFLPTNDDSIQLKTVVCDQAYIMPAIDNRHLIGATFQRGDVQLDLREADDIVNRQKIQQQFITRQNHTDVQSARAALRCVTPDRMPIVGPLADSSAYCRDYADLKKGKPAARYSTSDYHQGLYINTGHGSRGLTSSLLLSEWLAAQLNSRALPLSTDVIKRLHPARFLIRDLQRGRVTC